MSASSKATLFFSACAALFISASVDPPPFPKYKVDRHTMTVTAKRDHLTYVTLYTWAGAIPDTVKDTLRFFAQRGVQFDNENLLNGMQCVLGENEMIDRFDTLGFEVTGEDLQRWHDTWKTVHPTKYYNKLHLLTDTVMLFGADPRIPPKTLRGIVEREQWYMFYLWGDGSTHSIVRYWFVAFYLNKNGEVEHWVNSKKTISGWGKSAKEL